jgi:uncharacterized repeat protein (TIGR01451 family)
LLLGDSIFVNFDVISAGTGNATGVTLDMTVPTGITLNNVTATIGNCSNGAGTASCSIGALDSGASATVTLTVTVDAVGSAAIDATGSADLDEDANNNEATLNLTIDPAVDLVATASSTVRVQLNQSLTLQPTIDNLSPLTANNVSVTITPTAGLQLDSGSWAEGNCAIASGVLECTAASLSPNSSSAISVGATGTANGTQSYEITVSADEVDRDTANNENTGQVDVGSASTTNSGDDSGGGSLGFLSLFALLSTLAVRRRAFRLC